MQPAPQDAALVHHVLKRADDPARVVAVAGPPDHHRDQGLPQQGGFQEEEGVVAAVCHGHPGAGPGRRGFEPLQCAHGVGEEGGGGGHSRV